MKTDLTHIPNNLSAQIPTDALRSAMKALRSYRHAHQPQGRFLRKLRRAIISLTRELTRIEQFNERLRLKCRMLRCKPWRLRVTGDLGGAEALARWDARQERADATISAPRVRPYIQGEDIASVTADPNKDEAPKRGRRLDRDGFFYLAPVKKNIRKRTYQEQYAYWEASTWRAAMRAGPVRPPKTKPATEANGFRPIPLTPADLRGETMDTPLSHEDIRALDAAYAQQEHDALIALIAEPSLETCNRVAAGPYKTFPDLTTETDGSSRPRADYSGHDP